VSCISANVNEKKIKPSSDSSTMNSGKFNLQKEPNNMSENKATRKKNPSQIWKWTKKASKSYIHVIAYFDNNNRDLLRRLHYFYLSDMLLGSFWRLNFPEFIVLESDEGLIFFSLTLAEIQDTSSIYMQI
jgi:hypothetical protein